MEQAIFGAGCFWGVESSFRKLEGVSRTAVGYSGGSTDDPNYKEVCSGATGHAEVVLVEFEPEQVSYADLLEVFWNIHDPTQFNRQGPDVGTQYRSAIFCLSPGQQETASASKKALEGSGRFSAAIVTEITPASEFWMGEDYHQQYFEKMGVFH